MGPLFFVTIFSFLITFLATPVIIKISGKLKIFDVPNFRKIHSDSIPTVGGIAIFISILFTLIFVIPLVELKEFQIILIVTTLILFIGIFDDLYILSPAKKLVAEFLLAFILVKYGGFRIQSFHGFMGFNEMSPLFHFFFSCLVIVSIINAYNLIDGVDGLAGYLCLWSTLLFGLLFFYCGEKYFSILALSVASSLIGFLSFNSAPARIFMGDTGSLLLGTLNAILAIQLINFESPKFLYLNISDTATIAFGVLYIPLFDACRVFIIRIIQKKSPFSSDTNHIHHILIRKGFSHSQISLLLVILNAIILFIVLILQSFSTNYIFLFLILMGCIISLVLRQLDKKI